MSKKKQYPRTGGGTSDPIIVSGDQPLKVVVQNDRMHFEDMFGRRIHQTNIRLRHGYQGKNKERTTLYFSNLPEDAFTVDAIASEFDAIYAVDTNTKEYNGKWYSVGVCFRGEPLLEDGAVKEILFQQCGVCRGVNPIKADQIEQLVWVQAIEKTVQVQDKGKRILMVVDSFLGDIDAFNDRSKLLCGYFQLPENITLSYAKADVADEWPNKIIRHCDRMAGKYLEEDIEQTKENLEGCAEV